MSVREQGDERARPVRRKCASNGDQGSRTVVWNNAMRAAGTILAV